MRLLLALILVATIGTVDAAAQTQAAALSGISAIDATPGFAALEQFNRHIANATYWSRAAAAERRRGLRSLLITIGLGTVSYVMLNREAATDDARTLNGAVSAAAAGVGIVMLLDALEAPGAAARMQDSELAELAAARRIFPDRPIPRR